MDKLQKNRPSAVVGLVNVNQRVEPNIGKSGSPQHSRYAAADIKVDSVLLGVSHERLHQPIPLRERRIA